MGIKNYAVEQTGTLELLDTNDEPMLGDDGQPMIITLYSPGSKQYARAQAASQNRMLDKLKKKGRTEQSAEDKTRESAEFLTACTAGMSDNIGTDYPGLQGKDLYAAVYGDLEIGFVADQAAAFLKDWGNFTKGSPTP